MCVPQRHFESFSGRKSAVSWMDAASQAFGITWMADRYDQEKYKRPEYVWKSCVEPFHLQASGQWRQYYNLHLQLERNAHAKRKNR